jgi:hypothetical protein
LHVFLTENLPNPKLSISNSSKVSLCVAFDDVGSPTLVSRSIGWNRKTCLKRAGIDATLTHCALDDARQVIDLLKIGINKRK